MKKIEPEQFIDKKTLFMIILVNQRHVRVKMRNHFSSSESKLSKYLIIYDIINNLLMEPDNLIYF